MKVITILLLVTKLTLGTGLAAAQKQQRDEKAHCPDERPLKGKYVNHSYGFSIMIPNDLAGYWNSARCFATATECTCMSDHGRIIPLQLGTQAGTRQIEAYADHGSDLDDGTIRGAVESHLAAIREDSKSGILTMVRKRAIQLHGLAAIRVFVNYTDEKSGLQMAEDFVLATAGSNHYVLYLQTPAKDYMKDLPGFDAILKSFRLTQENRDY